MDARPEARGGGLAAAAVRLTGAWILAGALGKLFLGTPKLLPAVVRDLTPFSLTTTFQAVIAVEIFLAALAFLKPRLAWPVLAALLVFFDWILTLTIQAGEESCGCFGGSIPVSPWFMLAADTLLLVALIATAPWKRLWRPGAPLPWLLPAAAVAVLPPWLKIQADTGRTGPVAAAGADNGSVGSAAENPPPAGVDWVEWEDEPSAWVGRMIWDVTELTTYVDPGLLPAEGRVVIWRQGCSHCAEHLQAMKLADDGSQSILMVQIQDDLADAKAVELMPEGGHVTHATFPAGLQFMLQTPWELRLEGGAIASVLGPEDLEHEDG